MKNKYELALLLTAILWGFGFVFMDIAIKEVSALSLLSLRFLGSAILLALIVRKKIITISCDTLIKGCCLGVILFLAFAFQTFGLEYTTPSKNAFLTATNVVFVPLILRIIYKQQIEKKVAIGSVSVLVGIGFLSGLSMDGLQIGDTLTLIGAILFALHIVLIGKIINDDNLHNLVIIQLSTAGILSTLFGGATSTLNFTGINSVLYAVVYVVVFSTLITFFLQNYGLSKVDSSKGSILLATEALFGTIGSIIILNEKITLFMVVGFILMFVGIIIVEYEK